MEEVYFVYVLRSAQDNKFYIGYTDDLSRRYAEHRTGVIASTKNRRPIGLIYYEVCANKYDALHREKYLKSGPGHLYLRKRLKNFLGTQ